MQNKKIILFIAVMLVCLIVVILGFVHGLWIPNQVGNDNTNADPQAQKTVENFENLLENGISADNANSLFSYFSPDISEQDKIYKNKILEDIKNKKEQLNFKVLSYKISLTNYQITVEEVRDYKEKSNTYGSKFSRIFILEKINNNWKIKEYQKINNNNVYSGILSGSRKYDGFYP